MSDLRFEMSLANDHRIMVRKGDLTVEAVDAIVNAANKFLVHGGGLAGAIVDAGGDLIQQESDQIAPVDTGKAASTGAGALPCKRVIHAVGPIWKRQSAEESDQLLASAVTSSLEVALAEELTSISIPAISSGIFGFPKDRCAQVMFDAIEAFVRDHPDSTVKKINLCNFDEPTVAIFEAEARRRAGL